MKSEDLLMKAARGVVNAARIYDRAIFVIVCTVILVLELFIPESYPISRAGIVVIGGNSCFLNNVSLSSRHLYSNQ